MSATYRDIESAKLMAEAKVKAYMSKKMAEFYAPVAEDMMRMLLAQMPVDAKVRLREMDPEAFDRLTGKLTGGV